MAKDESRTLLLVLLIGGLLFMITKTDEKDKIDTQKKQIEAVVQKKVDSLKEAEELIKTKKKRPGRRVVDEIVCTMPERHSCLVQKHSTIGTATSAHVIPRDGDDCDKMDCINPVSHYDHGSIFLIEFLSDTSKTTP